MILRNHPNQRTCADCVKFKYCTDGGITRPTQTWCEWKPSRFWEIGKPNNPWRRAKVSKETSMEPYYSISEHEKKIALALVACSKSLAHGNVGFQVTQSVRAAFHAKESTAAWELTVSTGYENRKRDIYQIVEGELIYRYSETDDD